MAGVKLTSSTITTAGVTLDGKYSLAINEVNGEPCLCVHTCEVRDGLHFSPMNEESLVTAIGLEKLLGAVALMQAPPWRAKGRG